MKRKNRIKPIDHFALLIYPYVDSITDDPVTVDDVVYESYCLADVMLQQRQRYFKYKRKQKINLAEMKAKLQESAK